MKKKLIIIFLVFLFLPISAQKIAIGYYPFQNTLSIASNPEKLVWIDGRIETNTFYGNLNPEVIGLINIKRTDIYNIYTGLSCKMSFIDGFNNQNYIGGYSIYLGSRFKLIEKFPNFSFIFEIAPYMNKYFDNGLLRTFLGISYRL